MSALQRPDVGKKAEYFADMPTLIQCRPNVVMLAGL
jgi:hypothetical protein